MIIFDEEKRRRLKKIYETYREHMYRVSYKVIRDEYDAEDIVQNTILKISKLLDTMNFEDEDKTIMFLTVITKNTAIDYYRKKQKLCETQERDRLDELIDWRQVEDDVMNEYDYQALVQEIDNLPGKYAEILRLRYVFDLPVEKIMEQLSLSETNVYVRISRAKKLLMEALEKKK